MMRQTVLGAVMIFTMASALTALDGGMLKLVMNDAKVVTGANFERLRNSPSGQQAISLMDLEETQLESFVALTGFDPRRDLREALVATNSTEGAKGALAILRGQFDEAKIVGLAMVNGGKVQAYGPAKLIAASMGTGQPAPVIALLKGLIVTGGEEAVLAAVDRHQNGAAAGRELVSRIESAAGRFDAWVLTTAPPGEWAGRFSNPNLAGAMKGDLLRGIEHVTAGLRFGASVEMGGEAAARSDQDAKALLDVMRFLVQMATSNALGGPLNSLAGSLNLKAEGRLVQFTASMPGDDFVKLFGRERALFRPRI